MNTDLKLQRFRSLVQNKSLEDLKEQAGDQGVEAVLHIAEACKQQDTQTLLHHLDKYLILAGSGTRAIEIQHAELKPEAFNDIRDVLSPILNPTPNCDDGDQPEKKKRPWLRLFRRRNSEK